MKQLGKALRLIREFHRIKQKDLAKRLDISPSFLSEIEGGIKSPSFDLLEKYAERFSIPVSSIVMFSEAQDKGTDTFQYKIADKALKILEWACMGETEISVK